MWNKLDECWREVFRQSWEAYKSGTIPVGAVVVNEKNEIVSKGRNVSYANDTEHVLAGTAMGHAEMAALMQLKKEEHPKIKKYKLYVSLEPCPMCFGAVMMTGIKDVYYAAADSSAGSSVMQGITEYIEHMGVHVVKDCCDLEVFQIILQTSRGTFKPVKKIVETWEKEHHGAVELGRLLYEEKYFDKVIENNTDISQIYDYVLGRYSSEYN